MKMKVRVAKLQEAIHKHVTQEKKRFERETEKYNDDLARAQKKYIENVARYLADLREGKPKHQSYGLDDYLTRGCKFPTEPKDAATHADLLVRLDLAEDQILVVDDHSEYMKFLSGRCVCQ